MRITWKTEGEMYLPLLCDWDARELKSDLRSSSPFWVKALQWCCGLIYENWFGEKMWMEEEEKKRNLHAERNWGSVGGDWALPIDCFASNFPVIRDRCLWFCHTFLSERYIILLFNLTLAKVAFFFKLPLKGSK